MMRYSREQGYAKTDHKTDVEDVLKTASLNAHERMTIRCLLYDYEVLLKVIDGNAIFGHPDGSHVQRFKLCG